MQTFLPEPSFQLSLAYLDDKRLGKQRVETKQILRANLLETKGWRSHPASKMWRDYPGMLCVYGIMACITWRSRGFQDSLLPYFTAMSLAYPDRTLPWWIGNETFHRSHQSNLIRKDSARYGQIWPGVPSDLPYFWPV